MLQILDIIGLVPQLLLSMWKNPVTMFVEDSEVVAKVDHFYHRKLREAIEIERHAKNLNRDDGWKLSKSWTSTLAR